MKHLVYITGNLTFADLEAGRISKVEVMRHLIRNWLFMPAKHLAEMEPVMGHRYEHGMSLFALELLFFEPHGQFLTGADSQGKAGETFLLGFERFRVWLIGNNRIGQDFGGAEARKVRDWARNGLFHSGHIKDGLLVDIRRSESRSFFKNPIWEGWLVDPWELLKDIESYFESYVRELESESARKDSVFYASFEKTFDRMVVAPLATRTL
jgi:hypothetical protein